jgi:RNA polymerase sigma-70 factor (ECF subfamily)
MKEENSVSCPETAMTPQPSFEVFLAELRQRDEAAAGFLFHQCVDHLIRLARRRLDQRLNGKIDPDDVVQSVFRSVFVRLREGQFQQLGGWDGLWGLIITIMNRKCSRWREHFTAKRRDMSRERSLHIKGDEVRTWEPAMPESDPGGALELEETLSVVLRGLDEQEQQMIHLSLEGFDVKEVSEKLTCNYQRVYRVLRLVRQRLERLRNQGGQQERAAALV